MRRSSVGKAKITAPVVPAVPLNDAYCSWRSSRYLAFTADWSSSVSGWFRDGHVNAAVRWNTVRCRATLASSGIACTPDEPVPTMPMRLPSSSTGSSGHKLVCTILPSNRSMPGHDGRWGADRPPVAMTANRARNCSPVSVSNTQVSVSSSNVTAVTPVESRMSRRRS